MRRDPRWVSMGPNLLAGRTVIADALSGAIYRPQGMDAWILNLTVAGRGRIGRGAGVFAVDPGDLLIFPRAVPHDYGAASDRNGWTHLWVYFFPRPTWRDLLAWPVVSGGVLRVQPTDDGMRRRIAALFEQLVQLSRGPLPRRQAMAMNLLESMLLWCDTVNPASAQARMDARVRHAQAYLCEHFAEAISVPDLARRAALSTSRFSHLFRAQVGMTPVQYLEQQRINHARDLLVMTGKPVGDVGLEVGYEDPLYFSRIFKRHTGKSPREWRRSA
jgi:AraC family transcriptional regulator of arabinose operon